MKFIQASGGQQREAGKLDQLQRNHLVQLRQLQMLNQAATALPSLLTLIGTIGVFVIGGSMVIAKTMTLGTLVAFTAYLARATGPVHTLLGLWVALKRAEVSLARVHEVTGVEAAVVSPETPIELSADAGDIFFDDVSFAYPDSDERGGGTKIARRSRSPSAQHVKRCLRSNDWKYCCTHGLASPSYPCSRSRIRA